MKQMEAIKWLLCERQNLMLVAKTSVNKSPVPQAATAFRGTTIQVYDRST